MAQTVTEIRTHLEENLGMVHPAGENWLTNLLLARGLVKRQASVTFDVSRFDDGKCQAVLSLAWEVLATVYAARNEIALALEAYRKAAAWFSEAGKQQDVARIRQMMTNE